ncbi:MAG: hypothetical protein H7A24_15905 [Leptospiraceae bacterium]|nr:hypothetical protein [Leptospiraceae bacterium]MCP5513371.1 hypothetical protein [Leptospiraceae bacterium]
MQLEFIKTLEVKEFTCYIKLSVKRERLDVQKYLDDYNPNPDDTILKNINKYLEKRGWVYQGQITSKGDEIIKSGFIWDEEEGKYRLYCVLDDPLLDSIPLGLERLSPDRQNIIPNQVSDLSSLIGKEFNLQDKDYMNFKITEIPTFTSEQSQKNTKLIWKIEDEVSSIFEITNNFSLKGETKKIDFNSLLDQLFKLNSLYGEWSNTNMKLKVSFDQNKKAEMINFIKNEASLKTNQFRFGSFDTTKIYNIPLMPRDKANAEEWKKFLFEKELIDEYKNPIESELFSKELCEKEEFKEYGLDSSINTLKNSMKNLQKGKAFWHFFAPLDLNPKHQSYQIPEIETFSISPNSNLSFMDIVEKMNITQIGNISKIIYYDLYVINRDQQENFKIFIDAIMDKFQLKKIHVELITLFKNRNSNESRADLIKSKAPWITETDVKVISKNKINHDRYLIFFDENKQSKIWGFSNSIDFLFFSNRTNLNSYTKGISKDISIYSLKDDSILYPDLRTYINS